MKKVLSVLLAAAMVMGMSVSAFAADNDKVWGKDATDVESSASVSKLEFWKEMVVVRDGVSTYVDCDNTLSYTFEPGDVLYFHIMTQETNVAWNDGYSAYIGAIDKDWSINIKANDYVADAYFVAETTAGYSDDDADIANTTSRKLVCVELDEDYDDLDEDVVNFYFYIADNASKTKSAKATVKYDYDNENIKYVDFDFTNDADRAAKWVVKSDEKGTAVFDFEDDAYFTVKMVPAEEVILNLEVKEYVKAIDKAFDYEAEYVSYNFQGTSDAFTKTGELFIEADDETFIYAWDGELVEIDAEYVEDYEIDGTEKDGWVIETNELGWYVVADTEVEIEAEEVEESKPSTDKVNPETGANDFVGAAVALAVVSVAAAGALAFKK